MGQLDLSTRAGMLKGGLNGPSVVPGKAAESRLYKQVTGVVAPIMPMGGTLTEPERLLLRDWIDQGAQWETEVKETAVLSTPHHTPLGVSPQINAADREWWAFQKIKHPAAPACQKCRARPSSPIDAFIFRQFEEKGMEPAPRADRPTLIRRAYLDLVGLLPTPAEVDAFVNDSSPNAFAKVVDQLLASPRYGERWGRHWLDVVRYADSGGYEHDFDYPNAWRYRDYVIHAFNQDKPYDQFVREQLAGDELDNPTPDSLDRHRLLPASAPAVQFREKDNPSTATTYLDDMIATTSRGFMGLTRGLRPLPRPQVRSHHASGLLPHDGRAVPARGLQPPAGFAGRGRCLQREESRGSRPGSSRCESASPRSRRPIKKGPSEKQSRRSPKTFNLPSIRRKRNEPKARSCWQRKSPASEAATTRRC